MIRNLIGHRFLKSVFIRVHPCPKKEISIKINKGGKIIFIKPGRFADKYFEYQPTLNINQN